MVRRTPAVRLLFSVFFSVWLAPAARAQSFNIDVGTGTATPAATYRAAGNQPGVWNVHPGQDMTPFALVDLAGQPTGVTFEMPLPFGPATFDHGGTTGGDEDLLDDYFDLHSTPATFEIVGLRAGEYGVYTYAWGPDDAAFKTTVQVNGVNPVLIGGGWPGRLQEGEIYAHHWVSITSTESIAIYTYGRPRGTLNGLQIVEGESPPQPDAGVVDAELDAGTALDAEPLDTLVVDAAADASVDAASVDSGSRADSGPNDAGAIVDAGAVSVDIAADECGCRASHRDRGGASGLVLLAYFFLMRPRTGGAKGERLAR